jgi:hypothetical protein
MDKALRLMGLVTALVLVGCGGGRTTSSTLSGT